jgi:hypothetical protein
MRKDKTQFSKMVKERRGDSLFVDGPYPSTEPPGTMQVIGFFILQRSTNLYPDDSIVVAGKMEGFK